MLLGICTLYISAVGVPLNIYVSNGTRVSFYLYGWLYRSFFFSLFLRMVFTCFSALLFGVVLRILIMFFVVPVCCNVFFEELQI